MSNLLVPQFSSPRASPPPIESQEKPPAVHLDDPSTIPSCNSSHGLTMSEAPLPSTAKVPLSLLKTSSIGVQRACSFLSLKHCTKTLTLHTILQHPSILARLIAHMGWSDLYHLLCTCQHIRNLFQNTGLRDVILTRYVVGYGHCLRTRDLNHFHDVQISIYDLDLLCTSLTKRPHTTCISNLPCSDIPTLWSTPISNACFTHVNVNLPHI